MKKITLMQDIIKALDEENLLVSITGPSDDNTEITGISYNSKEVSKDFLFVIKGAGFREKYLEDAVSAGAACFVSEAAESGAGHRAYNECPGIYVSDVRKAMAVIAKTYYGALSDDLKVIGITGTKGKSTTAYFMRHILDDYYESCGKGKSAIISGIENYDGVTDEEASLTTPEVFEIYRHMDNAIKSGIGHMTMEVSSQALKYERVDGVIFDAAAFLNIGDDHISDIEHPDFEDYLSSKLLIFRQSRKACYSLETDMPERVKAAAGACPEVVTFSYKDESANVYAHSIDTDNGKVSMKVRARGINGYADFDEEFTPGTFGVINVENALAAITLSVLLGIPLTNIKAGLLSTTVPGRMELFKSRDGKKTALVDFAHNELSFDRFFEAAKEEFPGKKIIAVFGATGSKGVTRRSGMGSSAGRHCSYSILTEDDPCHEAPIDICNEVAERIHAEGGACEIILDREAAVKKAIELADENTVVFVAGRGRANTQKRGDRLVEIGSDVEFVEKYL